MTDTEKPPAHEQFETGLNELIEATRPTFPDRHVHLYPNDTADRGRARLAHQHLRMVGSTLMDKSIRLQREWYEKLYTAHGGDTPKERMPFEDWLEQDFHGTIRFTRPGYVEDDIDKGLSRTIVEGPVEEYERFLNLSRLRALDAAATKAFRLFPQFHRHVIEGTNDMLTGIAIAFVPACFQEDTTVDEVRAALYHLYKAHEAKTDAANP